MPAALKTNTVAGSMDGTTYLTIPGNVVPGEVMVLLVSRGAQLAGNAAGTTDVLNLTGWTGLHTGTSGTAATVLKSMAFWRKATASDPGSVVNIPNSAATGVMQNAHLSTWDSSGVYTYSGSMTAGNGTSVTWYNPATAVQRVGDTLLLLSSYRGNYANGYITVNYPQSVNLTGGVLDGGYLGGVATGQTLEQSAALIPIPAAKAGSTFTGTTSSFANSRLTYVIELGPTTKQGSLANRAYFTGSAGSPTNSATGNLTAKAKINALAQPLPERLGYLTARATTAGSGYRTIALHGSLTARAGIAGSGVTSRSGRGTLSAKAKTAGMAVAGADVFVRSGAGTLTATAGIEGEGLVLSQSHALEILYSTTSLTTKGVTLAPGLSMVPAGTVIAVDAVDGYGYPFRFNGPDGRDYPIGVLRETFIAGDYEEPANIIISGLLRLDNLTRYAVRALVDKRGAVLSLGRGVLRF